MSDIMGKIGEFSQEKYRDYVGNMNWPASKDEIVGQLKSQNAPDFVIKQAEKLPDKQYANIGDVVKESGSSLI